MTDTVLKVKNGALSRKFKHLKRPILTDSKFIQTVPVMLDNETIERLIVSKKYPLSGVMLNEEEELKFNACNVTSTYGTKSKSPNITRYVVPKLNFCVIKSKDKFNNPQLELVALYALENPTSIGLYYIPNGIIQRMCLIARVCHHDGTNSHANVLNSTLIGKQELHLHKTSEEFIKHCIKTCSSPSDLVIKLQSPDAEPIPGYEEKKHINIKQMELVAKEVFNVSDEYYHKDVSKRDLPEILQGIIAGEKNLGQEK